MSKGKAFGIGAGIGIAIGAILGLLFAPKPGKETRKMLAEKAKKLKEKIKIKKQ